MAIVILFGLAVGFINGIVVIRTKLPSFIVTLATFFVLQGVNAALTLKLTGTTAIQDIDAARVRSRRAGSSPRTSRSTTSR